MNIQRIVKLTSLNGITFYFSTQRLSTGSEQSFATDRSAEAFIEQFHFSDLEELSEIASWTSMSATFSHEYQTKTKSELLQIIAQGLQEKSFLLLSCLRLRQAHFIHRPTYLPKS